MYQIRLILTCLFLNAVSAKFLNVREDECLVQGVQCTTNCSAVVYCLTQGGQEILLDDCQSKGENCATIDNQVQCSAVESDCHSIAPEVPFQCVQSGSFPDPLNCSVSYTCPSGSPNPAVKCECEKGSFWDTRYGQCSSDPQGFSDCCVSLESKPKCDQQYDGSFGSCHPGYYYVCSPQADGKFQVVVLRCEPNMIYSPITHTCVPQTSSNAQKFVSKRDISPKTDPQCSLISSTTTEGTTGTTSSTTEPTTTSTTESTTSSTTESTTSSTTEPTTSSTTTFTTGSTTTFTTSSSTTTLRNA